LLIIILIEFAGERNLRRVGDSLLPRYRFYSTSGKHLCPDIVFMPCRENTSIPTTLFCHVGRTPLPRHRFYATSGKHLSTKKRPGFRSLSTSFNIFIQHLLRYRTGLPFLLFFLLLPAARLRSYTC